MELLYWALLSGIPAIDGCVRGRAFPELQMSTAAIYLGIDAMRPAVVADEKGNSVLITDAKDSKAVESMARAVTTTMGSSAAFVPAPLSATQLRDIMVPNAYSQAWRLGKTVLEARAAQTDPIAAIVNAENGQLLFSGKIIDIERKTAAGFVRGNIFLETLGSHGGFGSPDETAQEPRVCKLHFQNEFLTCEVDGAIIALVPDLISVLESETGRAIGTEELRYGLKASVIAIPASPLLCTEQALEVVGPTAFGLEISFEAGQVGKYREPTSAFASGHSSKL
eukprot:SAG31_NODE_884_length_11256_cov_2.889666_3_plen_281_part_00